MTEQSVDAVQPGSLAQGEWARWPALVRVEVRFRACRTRK